MPNSGEPDAVRGHVPPLAHIGRHRRDCLTDGAWRDILQHTLQEKSLPVLIVTSQVANDSLWAEVLNLAGYDVLAQPFDREEVTRVVTSAVRANSRRLWR